MMKKSAPASSAAAYVNELSGWQRLMTEKLRAAVKAAGKDLVEVIKWGHLVYFSNGPVLLIRAEAQRVLFGFWRGKRLRQFDVRLKASGKYELATMELQDGETVSNAVVQRLTKEAIRLNGVHGNPTKSLTAKPKPKPGAKRAIRRSAR
jgi:hypothetical protein